MKKHITLFIFSVFISHSVQANMIRDMAIMMGGMIGAQIANQAISRQMQEMFTALTHNQTTINNSITEFQTAIEKAQKDELERIKAVFEKAEGTTGTLQKEQKETMEQLNNYLLKAVSLQQPQEDFISDGPTFDQLYTLGTMYTPEGVIWKNPFQIGMWAYDEDCNSFWQYTKAPFLGKDHAGAVSSTRAALNSIFAPHITKQTTYEISGSITLHNVSYPFYAGVIFNKARWISGNLELLKKYRTIGIYGTADKQINIYFAEQQTTTLPPTKKSGSPTSITEHPIDQIEKGSARSLVSFKPELLANIQSQPIIFYFSIITSPTKIEYKIWRQGTKQPAAYQTISNLHSDLFIYHDIGFVSPGALAEFSLSSPKNLLFTKQAIQHYSGISTTKSATDLEAINALSSLPVT